MEAACQSGDDRTSLISSEGLCRRGMGIASCDQFLAAVVAVLYKISISMRGLWIWVCQTFTTID